MAFYVTAAALGTSVFLTLVAGVAGVAAPRRWRDRTSSTNALRLDARSSSWQEAADLDVTLPRFYLYEPAEYEPRFAGELADCRRKGADYMFVERLLESKYRTTNHREADVVVVPCLFESYRRCTTTNHAEKPPASLVQESAKYKEGRGRGQIAVETRLKAKFSGGIAAKLEAKLKPKKNETLWRNHPEDYEAIPWKKPLDRGTEECMNKVMDSSVYKESYGANHFWVAADWAMNFGRTIEQHTFKNMTIGRIEIVDEEAGRVSNRALAMNQSRCSVVVPYASDMAYGINFSKEEIFEEWSTRPMLLSFRFEDRGYVLYCGAKPCQGAVDATPLRHQALSFSSTYFHGLSSVVMRRLPLQNYTEELHASRFCLVVQGDTPSSHSFYDALAANCIPVVISDRWPLVARPLATTTSPLRGVLVGGYPYEAFSLQVTEHEWMHEPEAVAAKLRGVADNAALARQYYEALQVARRDLLWSMPGPKLTENVLQAGAACVRKFQEKQF